MRQLTKDAIMKKIDDLNNVSMNTVIAKKQMGSNSFSNRNFSSLLNTAKSDESSTEEKNNDNTLIQTQVLYKEAYLNRMMLELTA